MLHHLSINNYALINHLEIDFSEGLSIITGETGAGKSILLGAMGLVLGQRADMTVMSDKTKKCVIEGTFFIKKYSLKNFFSQNDIDYSDETIIRREINPNGNSRAFINDTPVSLAVLKELSSQLLDIHSQHQNLLLTNLNFQLNVLDSFSNNDKYLNEYQATYFNYKNLFSDYNELLEKERKAKTEQDFIQFQFDEIEKTNISDGELIKLENELKTLENSEEIKLCLNNAIHSIGNGEQAITEQIKNVRQQLFGAAKFNSQIKECAKRVDSIGIEMNDILNDLEKLEEHITHEPHRISELSERINRINHLLQKHRLTTDTELLELKNKFEKQLLSITSLENEIQKKNQELSKTKQILEEQSSELNKRRTKSAPKLETEIVKLLNQLGMPQARINIDIKPLSELTETGKDKINFLFSANKGGAFNELSKVASGGEISRLMLSIKSILAHLKSLPTVIFDEIDSGVSGEVAYKLGTILEKMSANMQVVAITHLPQIACKGKNHFEVFKSTEKNITLSNIKLLNNKERIEHIAKMLSGDKLSDAAIKNAKVLLEKK